jgi:hypothetical protein
VTLSARASGASELAGGMLSVADGDNAKHPLILPHLLLYPYAQATSFLKPWKRSVPSFSKFAG